MPILLLGRRVRRLSRDNQDRVADVSAYVDEAVHEIRTVQAYAHEAADRAAFARHAEAAYRSGVDAHRAEGLPHRLGDADRVLRGRRDPLGGRPRRVRRPADRGRAVGVRVLRLRRGDAAPARCRRSGASCSARPAPPSA
jgi:ABC-type multidrug transport system fused ATPase/permease subunit